MSDPGSSPARARDERPSSRTDHERPERSTRAARPDWVDRALATCARWFDLAPDPLRGRLSAVRARVASGQGAASVEGALTAPGATPFLALIEAFRADLGLPGEGVVDAVGEGALGLYFYLRIQDDMVDEPAAFGPSFAYAAEIFAGASVEGFARAAGGRPSFWEFRRAILDELSGAGVWELDTYHAMGLAEAGARAEEHAAVLGSKLTPTAIPLAALAAATGQELAFTWLGTYARSLGRALQIANDLLNARDDHEARRLTPSLAALYAGGRIRPGDEAFRVWPTLAGDAALQRMAAAATLHADDAVRIAAGSGAPELAAATAESAAVLRELPRRLLRLSLGLGP